MAAGKRGWSEANTRSFIDTLASTCNVTKAAAAARMSISAVYRRRAQDASFRAAWTLDPLGVVRFDDPPVAGATIAAGYLFDVPVRFGDDRLEVNRATFLAGEAPSVPLVEVREG